VRCLDWTQEGYGFSASAGPIIKITLGGGPGHWHHSFGANLKKLVHSSSAARNVQEWQRVIVVCNMLIRVKIDDGERKAKVESSWLV